MADKTTASKSSAKAGADTQTKINDLLQQVQDLMVEDGQDPATAEALTNFARQGSAPIVGNLADLQRMGAIAVTGEIPANAMPTGDQAVQKTSNIEDAFAEPPAAPAPPAPEDFAKISADAAKAEEKAK
jgi:Ca2+-binding RTX toxin-like protein